MRMELESSRSQWENADASARELLELQESLSGNTSDPYLTDLQNVARMYAAAGDAARAVALLRKAVAVADVLATPNDDWRRSQTRMDAARALANLGQFDEAITLGEAAVALSAHHARSKTSAGTGARTDSLDEKERGFPWSERCQAVMAYAPK